MSRINKRGVELLQFVGYLSYVQQNLRPARSPKSASSPRLGREPTFDALRGKLSCRMEACDTEGSVVELKRLLKG